jgi:hypothetical protein
LKKENHYLRGLSPDENFKMATLLTMRDQAMLVALSLSEADDEERDGKDIFPEIMRKYPPGLLGSAALLVRMLSGMIPPVNNDLRKLKKRKSQIWKSPDPLTSLCYAISQGVWTTRLARNAFGNVFLGMVRMD